MVALTEASIEKIKNGNVKKRGFVFFLKEEQR